MFHLMDVTLSYKRIILTCFAQFCKFSYYYKNYVNLVCQKLTNDFEY